jgi:signal transduction histidine kinase
MKALKLRIPARPRDIRRRLIRHTVGLLLLAFVAFSAIASACYYSLMRSEFDEGLEKVWAMKAAYFKPGPDGNAVRVPPPLVFAKDSNFRMPYYELWTADGTLVYRSENFSTLGRPDIFGAPELELLRTDHGRLRSVDVGTDGDFRVKASPLKVGDKTYLFRVGSEQSDIDERLLGLVKTFTWLVLVFWALAYFAADWLIRRTLRPVEMLRRQAERISGERLHERLPVAVADDEIGQLATTLNKMLDRLQDSLDEMTCFTSDASHELRTPLAAIRALGESILHRGDATREELRDALGEILEETQRLTGLTERLLTMARLDCQTPEETRTETFDVSAQARRIVEHLEVLASEKDQALEIDVPESLPAVGNAILVHQAITNLVDNAIKYTPEKGRIRVLGTREGGSVRLSVVDNGPGIAPEHQENLFRRFYRVDSDRARGTGGYGIGLSIAQRALEISNGRMELESTPGLGSRFTVVLRAPEASA